MSTTDLIVDSVAYRSQQAATTAIPGSIAIQNIADEMCFVDDQGVAVPIGSTTFDVRFFGAAGDAQAADDAVVTTTLGVTHVSSATATFTADDVGKTIWVTKPTASVSAYLAQTTIASFVSAHEVTTVGVADTTGTGCRVRWGTDDTAAFIRAFDAATASGTLHKDTISIPSAYYLITSRWYDYATSDVGGPNVVSEDGLGAFIYVSPSIPIPVDGSPVMMRAYSDNTVIKNIYYDGSGANLAFAAFQHFIEIRGNYLTIDDFTVANVAGNQIQSYDIRFFGCRYLEVNRGGCVMSAGLSTSNKLTRPVQFQNTTGNVNGFATSNMYTGAVIEQTPKHGGIDGGVPLNFNGCPFDETISDTGVNVRNGGEASFWGCLMWCGGLDGRYALVVGAGGGGTDAKAWLWGCNVGPYGAYTDTTAKAISVDAGSEVHVQGTTLRCASPSGTKRVVDNAGTFYDDGGNSYLWGNSDVDGPSVPVPFTSTLSVAAQVFLNPPVLVGGATQSMVHVGRNGAGAVTLTGARVGQRVRQVLTVTAGALVDSVALFETTITVADQVQQLSATNLSAVTYSILLQDGL